MTTSKPMGVCPAICIEMGMSLEIEVATSWCSSCILGDTATMDTFSFQGHDYLSIHCAGRDRSGLGMFGSVGLPTATRVWSEPM